jgi:hypothetical protein
MKILSLNILIILVMNNHLNAQVNDIFSANKFPKGIYFTYSDFKNNSPDTIVEFTIEVSDRANHTQLNNGFYNQVMDEDTVMLVSYLRNRKGKLMDHVYAFSDGDRLYINSALYQNHGNYYLRVIEVGKIILFKDPIMNKAQSANNGYLIGGVIGAVIGISVARKDSNGVILFYQDDGIPYKLSERTMKAILKANDSDLYNKFMAIEKPYRDSVLEQFVIDFNNRHK